MPLMLVTGKPRNGKTLYVLSNIKKWFPGRPVFYRRIDQLDKDHFGFQELTDHMMKNWWELPPKSVVLMDECHYDLPSRMQGTPPEWIGRLTEHGHYGLDFVLITQHPMNMDVFVRRLCQPYFIVKRIWGSNRATIIRGEEYFDPDDGYAKKNAEKTIWKYPKEIFGKYHSAEAHTVKRRIPRAAIIYGAVCVGVVGLAGYAYSIITEPPARAAAQVAGAPGQKPVRAAAAPGQAASGPYGLLARVSAMPRDALFPDSAPIYDKVRAPVVDAPRVAGCWSSGSDHCECRNQQGFKIAFTLDQCRYHLTQTFNPYVVAQVAPRHSVAPTPKPFSGAASGVGLGIADAMSNGL